MKRSLVAMVAVLCCGAAWASTEQELVAKTEKMLSKQGLSLKLLQPGLESRMTDPARNVSSESFISGKTVIVVDGPLRTSGSDQLIIKPGKVVYRSQVITGFFSKTISDLQRTIHPLKKTGDVQLSVEKRCTSDSPAHSPLDATYNKQTSYHQLATNGVQKSTEMGKVKGVLFFTKAKATAFIGRMKSQLGRLR